MVVVSPYTVVDSLLKEKKPILLPKITLFTFSILSLFGRKYMMGY